MDEVLAKIGGGVVKDKATIEDEEFAVAESEAFVKASMEDVAVQTELAEPLAHEVMAAKAKESKLDVVLSTSGLAHAVLAGPPEFDLQRSTTRCGWRFAASGASLVSWAALPSSHKALCARCFPEQRAAAKASLASAARNLGALGASAASDLPGRTL